MNNRRSSIDLVKMALYILKRCWLVVICAAIGFGYMYWRAGKAADTYTASGTMYIYNANPNLVNYGYTNMSDLNSAVQLVDTYAQVVKSNRVLDAIVERMTPDHPGITTGRIAGSLTMASVSETGVVRVSSRTTNPVLSADIVNTVLDVAPSEIKRVVGAGDIEIIDYASAPERPDARQDLRRGMTGALYGAVAAAALLALLFLLNRKITDTKELTEQYTLPVLASIRRQKGDLPDPGAFVLHDKSAMEIIEGYAKLRMNLLYTLVGKESKSVTVVSAISGEGKSTIAANLSISLAQSGKRVLLVDADLRRACQQDIFYYDHHLPGLSDVLIGEAAWQDTVIATQFENLDVMPTGHLPPNPSEMLESDNMKYLLKELEAAYDLVLLDVPPINIVSDPLALADRVAGAIFVVRQNFSDHREVRKALKAAEMTGLDLLGFVFYGEKLRQGSYYSRRYYKSYYHKYDSRNRGDGSRRSGSGSYGSRSGRGVQQDSVKRRPMPAGQAAPPERDLKYDTEQGPEHKLIFKEPTESKDVYHEYPEIDQENRMHAKESAVQEIAEPERPQTKASVNTGSDAKASATEDAGEPEAEEIRTRIWKPDREQIFPRPTAQRISKTRAQREARENRKREREGQ